MGTPTSHPETIKARLRIRHGSLLAFEKAAKLKANSVKDVLRGRRSAPTERAISKELRQPLHVLFPARYRAPKVERHESTKVDNNSSSAVVHRLNARAG